MTELFDVSERYSQAMDDAYGTNRKKLSGKSSHLILQPKRSVYVGSLAGAAFLTAGFFAYLWLNQTQKQWKDSSRYDSASSKAA